MRAVSSEDVEKLVYIVRGCARDERQVVSLSLSLFIHAKKNEIPNIFIHLVIKVSPFSNFSTQHNNKL